MDKKSREQAHLTHQHAGIAMCANCMHYQQHYFRHSQGYLPLHCGHCKYPRCKHRTPTDVCDNFTCKIKGGSH